MSVLAKGPILLSSSLGRMGLTHAVARAPNEASHALRIGRWEAVDGADTSEQFVELVRGEPAVPGLLEQVENGERPRDPRRKIAAMTAATVLNKHLTREIGPGVAGRVRQA